MIAEIEKPQIITRRDFIVTLGTTLILISLPVAPQFLSGCASAGLPRLRVLPEGNLIRVPLTEAPALAVRGGAVSVSLPKRQAMIVVHLQENEYLALSPVCTHRGCIVRKVKNGFECPCHGSRYDQSGEVVEGPAPRALNRYPLELQGTELLIRYQS